MITKGQIVWTRSIAWSWLWLVGTGKSKTHINFHINTVIKKRQNQLLILIHDVCTDAIYQLFTYQKQYFPGSHYSIGLHCHQWGGKNLVNHLTAGMNQYWGDYCVDYSWPLVNKVAQICYQLPRSYGNDWSMVLFIYLSQSIPLLVGQGFWSMCLFVGVEKHELDPCNRIT